MPFLCHQKSVLKGRVRPISLSKKISEKKDEDEKVFYLFLHCLFFFSFFLSGKNGQTYTHLGERKKCHKKVRFLKESCIYSCFCWLGQTLQEEEKKEDPAKSSEKREGNYFINGHFRVFQQFLQYTLVLQ